MPDLVEDTSVTREEIANSQKVALNGDANVAVLSCLQKEVLAVKNAVLQLLRAAKKTWDLRVDAEKTF